MPKEFLLCIFLEFAKRDRILKKEFEQPSVYGGTQVTHGTEQSWLNLLTNKAAS